VKPFRLATPADVPAILELVNLAYRVEEFFVRGGRADEAEVRRDLAAGAFILAEGDDGTLAGCVNVAVSASHGHFGMLGVRPGAQSRGLGRALVSAAEDYCLDRGCEDVNIEVVDLRTELLPWYRSLGYSECGTAPFAAPDRQLRPCHFILMRRALPARATLEAVP